MPFPDVQFQGHHMQFAYHFHHHISIQPTRKQNVENMLTTVRVSSLVEEEVYGNKVPNQQLHVELKHNNNLKKTLGEIGQEFSFKMAVIF